MLDPEPDGGYPGGNTAEGDSALENADINLASPPQGAEENTALGWEAARFLTTGHKNTAIGSRALLSNTTGNENLAVGDHALGGPSTNNQNIALGSHALSSLSNGDNNIGIGYNVGVGLFNGSNNIYIGSPGGTPGAESNKIRIGAQGIQDGAFIAGIVGHVSSGQPVAIDSDGRLGTTNFPSASPSGSYLFLAEGTSAPSGYTKLGTWSTVYKDVDGHGHVLEADVYVKD